MIVINHTVIPKLMKIFVNTNVTVATFTNSVTELPRTAKKTSVQRDNFYDLFYHSDVIEQLFAVYLNVTDPVRVQAHQLDKSLNLLPGAKRMAAQWDYA